MSYICPKCSTVVSQCVLPHESAAPDLYCYRAHVTNVVDGDTCDCLVSCGLWITTDQRLRLCSSSGRGIDSPEPRGPEREAGRAATKHLETLLTQMAGPGWPVYLRTFRDRRGKFGRLLADVFVTTLEGPVSICDRMVRDGFAEMKDY